MTEPIWYLDEIRPTDKNAFLEHFREREIYNNTLNIPYPYTERNADEWIKLKAQETKANGRPVSFAIRLRENNLLIGSAGFDSLRIGQSKVAEIGYWLAKPYWNQGLMTAVVKEVCRIGLNDFGLTRIEARVFSFNFGSARVLEKCGFIREANKARCQLKDGEYKDIELYALELKRS